MNIYGLPKARKICEDLTFRVKNAKMGCAGIARPKGATKAQNGSSAPFALDEAYNGRYRTRVQRR